LKQSSLVPREVTSRERSCRGGDRADAGNGHQPLGGCRVRKVCFRNRSVLVQSTPPKPKTAFSRFPPVHRTNEERRQRVDFTSSPSRRRTAGICAQRTAGIRIADVADRGLDVRFWSDTAYSRCDSPHNCALASMSPTKANAAAISGRSVVGAKLSSAGPIAACASAWRPVDR
jgi:hypothetical protein